MGDEGGLLLQFRILGPLEVVRGGECLPFRGSRERALLALLVLNANRTVSAERLAEDLWSGDPPEGAIRSLRVYVSRLRQALGAAGQAVVTRPSGYVLQVDPEAVDALRFEALVARGRDEAKAGDHDRGGGDVAGGAGPVAGSRPGRCGRRSLRPGGGRAGWKRPAWPPWRTASKPTWPAGVMGR